MKKLTALLLALLFISGCAAKPVDKPEEDKPEPPQPQITIKQGDEDPEPQPDIPEKIVYEPGIQSETGYENAFFGFCFALPEDWVWNGVETLELGAGYEFHAGSADGLMTLGFVPGECGDFDAFYESYLAELPAALTEGGYSDWTIEETETLGMKTVKIAASVLIEEGLTAPIYLTILLPQRDGYYGELTVTSFVLDNCAEILSFVEKIA